MGLTDYTDLEKDITNSQEPKVLAKGMEVKARIIAMNEGISEKNNAQWYMPVFDVPADPMVIEFNDFFWDLAAKDKIDPKQFVRALHKFKTFAQAFGVDFSKPFDWEDLIGKEGWVIVGIKKDDEYGDKNSVSKYIVKR
jgi:hypothetical protein